MDTYENFYAEENSKTLSAIQPLMIFASSKYYKKSVMRDGISHFYRYTVSEELMKKVLVVPDGSIDILFNVNIENPQAVCYGSPLKLSDINYVPFVKKHKEIFGVRLMPGNTHLPGKSKVSDFTNKEVNLASILDEDDELIKKICSCDDFYEQTRIFTNWYLNDYRKRIINVKENNLCDYILTQIIDNKGNIKIEDISTESGYSTRYISKLFNEFFGMSPKLFCKIVRFQNALRAVTENEKIIDIAEMLGFFDQSHLGKEFKTFAGLSPKKLNQILKTSDYQKRLYKVE